MLTRPRRSTSLGGIVAVIASVVAGTAALVAVAPVAVAAPATWGGLVPGPYPVGFRQLEVRDPARPFRAARTLDGRARRGDQARPIRISLWYPATAASGEPLTVGDYAALMGVEDRLGPVTRERARIGERTFFAAELLRDLDPGQRQALLRLAGIARRGAPAAPGRFPIVLYSLGSAALGPITPEYLASHGYLVAQAPRLGATAGMPTDWRDELELLTRMADLDRVVAAVGALPQADPDALAAIGFSAGGRWALQAAMSNPHVRAVVSLDTVMLFDDDGGHAWRRYPAFDLEAVRVPVLHAIRAEWVPREDPAMWRAMRHADRTTLRFDDPALHHLDFQSVGLAMTLVGSRADRARSVRTAFDVWNRATLAFLDAHLAGARHGAGARRPLIASNTASVVVTRIAAERPTVSRAELFNEIADRGAAAVVADLGRRAGPAGRPVSGPRVAERDLTMAAYGVLLSGQPVESIPVFELLARLYPRSANAHDSLADAYLASGDRARALTHTRRARQLLDADRSLPADRRAPIQKSIDDKLRQLR